MLYCNLQESFTAGSEFCVTTWLSPCAGIRTPPCMGITLRLHKYNKCEHFAGIPQLTKAFIDTGEYI